jgi:hypothetical protein
MMGLFGRDRRAARRYLPAGVLLVLVLIGSVIVFTRDRSALPPLGNVQPGVAAPSFTLHAVRGGTWTTASVKRGLLLLSFLALHDAAAAQDRSHSQAIFLKSLDRQYGPRGLHVAIVDATALATGRAAGKDALLNATYDWDLAHVPVLSDPDGATARRYGVTRVPTTFVIGKDGIARQRWDGFVSAAQLAFAVQPLLAM